ncbi:hypothetical protein EW146_g7510, partial [Bondarzewia mesenterica]
MPPFKCTKHLNSPIFHSSPEACPPTPAPRHPRLDPLLRPPHTHAHSTPAPRPSGAQQPTRPPSALVPTLLVISLLSPATLAFTLTLIPESPSRPRLRARWRTIPG